MDTKKTRKKWTYDPKTKSENSVKPKNRKYPQNKSVITKNENRKQKEKNGNRQNARVSPLENCTLLLGFRVVGENYLEL